MNVRVTFKTECHTNYGEPAGPVRIIDTKRYENDPVIAEARARNQLGIPYGYEPRGVVDCGWLVWQQAKAIADALGVTLEQS